MDKEQRAHQQFSSKVDRLLRIIAVTLDETVDGNRLASDACMSRFHFQRTFMRKFGESPGALPRLLLERSAHELQETTRDVTEIAFDAGYQSLEGFSRGFRRSFLVSPSYYRRLAPLRYRIQKKRKPENNTQADQETRKQGFRIGPGAFSLRFLESLVPFFLF